MDGLAYSPTQGHRRDPAAPRLRQAGMPALTKGQHTDFQNEPTEQEGSLAAWA